MAIIGCDRRFSNELRYNIRLGLQNQLPAIAIGSFKVRIWVRRGVRNNHSLSTPIIPQFCTFDLPGHSFYTIESQALLRIALLHPSIPHECANNIVLEATSFARSVMGDLYHFLLNPSPRAMFLAIEVIFDTPPNEAYERDLMGQNMIPTIAVLTKTAEESLKKVKFEGETDNCSICFMEFNKDEEVSATPCQHVYHHGCIVKWLVRSPTCPLCRHPIESN